MEQIPNRRPVVKRKRLRKRRTLFTLLVLLFVALFIFIFVQYNKGKDLAGDQPQMDLEFEADEFEHDIENYLIIGVDSRGESKSRSDTMMMLSWNHKTNDMKLVSFMRDIYVDIPEYGYSKLNAAFYHGGVNLLKDTLKSMFDVPIHHYALIDFKSFETMIDILAPDGVEMDVEKDMSQYIGVELTKGVHQLNGQELLGYARFRHDQEGDFGRVARQQKVIEALKQQVLTPANVKNVPKFVGAAQGYVATDLTKTQQLKSVLSAVSGGMAIEKLTIPAQGTYQFNNYTSSGSVIEINVEENKQILQEFLEQKQD